MDTKDEDVKKEKSEEGKEKDGVVIPEEFQQATHELLQKASSKHHLSHIRDRVYAKEDEMRKEEEIKKPKGVKDTPAEYSTAGMPD